MFSCSLLLLDPVCTVLMSPGSSKTKFLLRCLATQWRRKIERMSLDVALTVQTQDLISFVIIGRCGAVGTQSRFSCHVIWCTVWKIADWQTQLQTVCLREKIFCVRLFAKPNPLQWLVGKQHRYGMHLTKTRFDVNEEFKRLSKFKLLSNCLFEKLHVDRDWRNLHMTEAICALTSCTRWRCDRNIDSIFAASFMTMAAALISVA
jgi:hypothetical protein